MRAVHDLKSAAGTLGMHALMDAAAALERDCAREAPASEVDASLQTVTDKLDDAIDQVLAFDSARAA